MRYLWYALTICVLLFFSSGESLACRKDVVLTSDKPLSHQMKKKGTYIVRDVIDLKGQAIEIPKNSKIVFDGGGFQGGVVKGNNTLLEGDIKCYSEIKGTFKNRYFEAEWFTENHRGLTDFLKQTVATNVNEIVINDGEWLVSETVVLRSGIKIRGEEGNVIKVDRNKISGPYVLFRLWGEVNRFSEDYKYSDIQLSNITFNANGSNTLGRTCFFAAASAEKINVSNCRFIDEASKTYADYVNAVFTFYNCRDCKIVNNYTEYLRLVSLGFCVNCVISHNKGYNSPGTWLESCDGHHLAYEYNELHENLFPKNSTICQNSRYGIIRNNVIIVNGKEVDSMINIGHSSSDVYENSGDGCIIEGNEIHTEYSKGIIAWGNCKTDNLTIRNNKVYAARNHAIYLSPDVQTVYITGNTLTGHSQGQLLVRCEAMMSYIRDNHITIDVPGEKYIPLRLKRYDNEGKAVVEGNIIDNGGEAPFSTKDESIIDVSMRECIFKNNTVNDGVHFLNVSPSIMTMTGNTFNDVQNVFWHSNNVAERPLDVFVVKNNTINVNTAKAGEYLNLFSINGERAEKSDIVRVENNKIDYGGRRNMVVVNLKNYKGNGSFKESTNSQNTR